MAVPTLATARARLWAKVRAIIEQRIRGAIDDHNTEANYPSGFTVPYPRGSFIGGPSDVSAYTYDGTPVVIITGVGSTPDADDVGYTQNDVVRFLVGVGLALDRTQMDEAARIAQAVALVVGQTLQKHLPDPTGTPYRSVFRVDLGPTILGAPRKIGNSTNFFQFASMELEVYTRVAQPYTPNAIAAAMPVTAFVEANAERSNAALATDPAGTTATLAYGAVTTVTISAGNVATLTSVILTPATAPATGSIAYAVNQRGYAAQAATVATGAYTLTKATLGLQTGDEWAITSIDATTRAVTAWVIHWTVTP